MTRPPSFAAVYLSDDQGALKHHDWSFVTFEHFSYRWYLLHL